MLNGGTCWLAGAWLFQGTAVSCRAWRGPRLAACRRLGELFRERVRKRLLGWRRAAVPP